MARIVHPPFPRMPCLHNLTFHQRSSRKSKRDPRLHDPALGLPRRHGADPKHPRHLRWQSDTVVLERATGAGAFELEMA
jgi:hypothetical protein